MVSYFLNYLKQKATIDQVKALLEDICNRLPDAISKQVCPAAVGSKLGLATRCCSCGLYIIHSCLTTVLSWNGIRRFETWQDGLYD